eukprot:5496978-Prymnesium_polylepis.1
MLDLDWRRVGIIHDDSRWADSTATTFISEFEAKGGTIVNLGASGFRIADFEAGAVTPDMLFDGLEAAGARIVCMWTQPQMQRQIFAAAYRTARLYGNGFGWFTGWHDDSVTRFPDGTVDADAARGAEGVLGLDERVDYTTEHFSPYASSYQKRSSQGGCTDPSPTRTLCDADGGASSSIPLSALLHADAVLLYAKAMQSVYRISPYAWQPLQAAALGLAPFNAISSSGLVLDQYGDRKSDLVLFNFQQDDASSIVFREVGLFSFATGISVTSALRYPGNVNQPPLDVDLSVVGCAAGMELIADACQN